jgi:arginase
MNDEVMPAVDYRMPDGLWPDELVTILRLALRSRLVAGMDVTIYNPSFDDGTHSAARVLASALTRAYVNMT